ncbi:hypothetical protein ABPG72_020918 [Tetrahymena utriculariae]
MIETDKLKSNLTITDQFLIENYKKCSLHPKKQLAMLRIDDEQEQHQLECLHSVYKQQNKQYLPLDLFIDSNELTIFKGWPVFDDSQIYENLLVATQQESYKEENIQNVKIFFKELKAKVFELIEQKESELLQIVEQYSNSNTKILEEYNSLSQKERLKDILLNNQQDLETQDKLLKDLIKENKLNQQRNKDRLEDVLNTQKLFKINMIPYYEIKENIIQIVSNINCNIENRLAYQIDQAREDNSNRNYIEINQIKDLPNCKNFENIKINLNKQNIGVQDIDLLSSTLNAYPCLKTLELNLKGNKITDSHLQDIEKSLENHKVDKLFLNLAKNNITIKGATSIQKIIERLPSITNLSINLNNNKIKDQGVQTISKSLLKCQEISHLKLGLKCNEIKSEGALYIAQAIKSCNKIIRLNLNLKYNSIKDQEIDIIISALQKCKQITDLNLDLRENDISEIAKSNLKKVLESQNLRLVLKF